MELATSDPEKREGPCLWAVGGGKGGVGKSMITSNLAIALARRGRRIILVDADLGGGNLHTILGIKKPHRTLSNFMNREVESLDDVICETGVPNLSLVSGSGAFLAMANPKHSQKERLLRQIRTLPADDVLLDLAAGSAFNTLDFFLEAKRGVVVVVPEPTSLENAYHFLKAAFFRSLSRAAREPRIRHLLEQVMKDRKRQGVNSPRELIDRVASIDSSAGRLLEEQTQAFQPMLIVNQVRTAEQRGVGPDIATACREYLGTEVQYLGAVARDEAVHAAVSQQQPVLSLHPYCAFSRDVEALAARLLDEEEPNLARADELRRSYLHSRSLFGKGSLATHGLLSDEDRQTQLTRIEARYSERLERWSQPRRSVAEPVAKLPALDPAQPGAFLKRCRELLGLTPRQAYERTRLATLDAIEREAWGELPPEPYRSRHLAAYAYALGVADAEAVARAVRDLCAPAKTAAAEG
jgi:flagellar biosynthesis protein FlhG